MTNSREYFINEPEGLADAVIIWLHGLGADGRDFAGLPQELGLPKQHKVRFIFPNAPYASVTINGGMQMRAWYDIYNLANTEREDTLGIKQSQNLINELIQAQITQGIAHDRIILGGFSQGGAMSLYVGLRFPQKLAGIICLSGYLPLSNAFNSKEIAANLHTPIFMAHGMFDPIVSYNFGQATRHLLLEQKLDVQWQAYPMEHTVCLEELTAIGDFVKRCLGYA